MSKALLGDLFGDDSDVDWRCRPDRHIARERQLQQTHFDPSVVKLVGIALFAIEMAAILRRCDGIHLSSDAVAQDVLLF